MTASWVSVGLAALAAGTALGAGGAFWALQATPQVPSPSPPAAASAGAVREVVALGYIEPLSGVIKVGAPGSQDPTARLEGIAVTEGAAVRAGDVLAVLDSAARLRAATEEARATLALRRSQLDRAEIDAQSKVVQQRAIVAQKEAAFTAAERELGRYQDLLTRGFVSVQALEDKRLTANAATRELAEARLALAQAQARGSGKDLIDAQVARNEVSLAQAALERTRLAAEAALVRAPTAGRVLRILARPGETVSAAGVLELADVSRMGVRFEVDQVDVGQLALGQAVRSRTRGPEAEFTGRVTRISSEVKRQTIFDSDAAARVDGRSVEVWAELDEESGRRAASLINSQVSGTFARERARLR